MICNFGKHSAKHTLNIENIEKILNEEKKRDKSNMMTCMLLHYGWQW